MSPASLLSNSLSGLPEALSGLRRLRVLRLKYNQLEALPAVLVSLDRLEVLELADNRISSLDDVVLSRLRSVRYANTHFTDA